MQTRTHWLPSGREHYTGRSSFALLKTVRFARRQAASPLSQAGDLHPISNKEVLALAGSVWSLFELRTPRAKNEFRPKSAAQADFYQSRCC